MKCCPEWLVDRFLDRAVVVAVGNTSHSAANSGPAIVRPVQNIPGVPVGTSTAAIHSILVRRPSRILKACWTFDFPEGDHPE